MTMKALVRKDGANVTVELDRVLSFSESRDPADETFGERFWASEYVQFWMLKIVGLGEWKFSCESNRVILHPDFARFEFWIQCPMGIPFQELRRAPSRGWR